jgi:NAD(P)-dependent dehydrogenase (short-subunit alcohol dehydrogenase family)
MLQEMGERTRIATCPSNNFDDIQIGEFIEMDFENGYNAGITDKVALVSGGASGIGKACVKLLSTVGAKVAFLDIDIERGKEVAKEINDQGGKALFLKCDVSKDEPCRRAIEQTVDTYGRLDMLVNAAGIVTRASVLDTSEASWDKIISVNLKSVYLLSRHSIPLMAQAGGGTIINISSGWGLVGGKNAAAYCASKGAVVLLTKAMAIDHGFQNIRVNCVCPGDTDTPMLQSEAIALGITYDQLVQDSAKDRPLGRIGTPMDIAHAVLFLASNAAAFITGSILVVDGGGLAGTG